MQASDESQAVFLSYAWGVDLQHKEWVRQSIVTQLDWKYPVFWDRDSIGFGESIDATIATALQPRPLWVLCLCDEDYLAAAQRSGSGLQRELQMLEQVVDTPGVRVLPVLLAKGCAARLPSPLAGRVYLDLSAMHQHGLNLGAVLLDVLQGATQAQVHGHIRHRVERWQLRQRLGQYLMREPLSFLGNGRTHEVVVRSAAGQRPLLAPQWMWRNPSWNYLLVDDTPSFCPRQARWPWDRNGPSRGIRVLGAAMISQWFPQPQQDDETLGQAGSDLAVHFLTTVEPWEAFTFDADDVLAFLLNDDRAAAVLEELLRVAETATAL